MSLGIRRTLFGPQQGDGVCEKNKSSNSESLSAYISVSPRRRGENEYSPGFSALPKVGPGIHVNVINVFHSGPAGYQIVLSARVMSVIFLALTHSVQRT